MRNALFILLIFGVVFLVGCSTPSNSTKVEYTSYSGTGFSIDYPSDWNIEEGDGYVQFVSKRKNLDDVALELFEISFNDENWGWKEAEATERSLMFEGDRITNQKQIQFKGRDALVIESEGPQPDNGELAHYKAIYVKYGTRMYRLGYGYEKAKEQDFKFVLERILNSFEAQ